MKFSECLCTEKLLVKAYEYSNSNNTDHYTGSWDVSKAGVQVERKTK